MEEGVQRNSQATAREGEERMITYKELKPKPRIEEATYAFSVALHETGKRVDTITIIDFVGDVFKGIEVQQRLLDIELIKFKRERSRLPPKSGEKEG